MSGNLASLQRLRYAGYGIRTGEGGARLPSPAL